MLYLSLFDDNQTKTTIQNNYIHHLYYNLHISRTLLLNYYNLHKIHNHLLPPQRYN